MDISVSPASAARLEFPKHPNEEATTIAVAPGRVGTDDTIHLLVQPPKRLANGIHGGIEVGLGPVCLISLAILP